MQLASCHFIEHGDNVLVLGPPGVGKAHLSVALRLKAIAAGYRVLFSSAANLITTLYPKPMPRGGSTRSSSSTPRRDC